MLRIVEFGHLILIETFCNSFTMVDNTCLIFNETFSSGVIVTVVPGLETIRNVIFKG